MPAQNKHEPWSDDVFLTNTSLRSRLIRQVLTRSRALSYPKNPPSDLLATKTPIFLMIFGKGECRRTRRTSNENLTKSAKIAAFWQGSFYSGLACQPRINTRTSLKELIFAFALTAAVTFAFYFILKALGWHTDRHDFGCDKFYIGLFYIQKKSAAQFVLRKQRYSAYNIMVVRVRKRSVADSGNRMFLRVPRKRRIRIYKLDKNRKTTGKFFRRRRTTVKRTRYFTQT